MVTYCSLRPSETKITVRRWKLRQHRQLKASALPNIDSCSKKQNLWYRFFDDQRFGRRPLQVRISIKSLAAAFQVLRTNLHHLTSLPAWWVWLMGQPRSQPFKTWLTKRISGHYNQNEMNGRNKKCKHPLNPTVRQPTPMKLRRTSRMGRNLVDQPKPTSSITVFKTKNRLFFVVVSPVSASECLIYCVLKPQSWTGWQVRRISISRLFRRLVWHLTSTAGHQARRMPDICFESSNSLQKV